MENFKLESKPDRKSYEPPAIVDEAPLEVRAGSPLSHVPKVIPASGTLQRIGGKAGLRLPVATTAGVLIPYHTLARLNRMSSLLQSTLPLPGSKGCWLLTFIVLWLLAGIATGCAASVRVEWVTETEINTAGFNLYRSESPTGPFDLKVNDQLIPASPDPLIGGRYSFTDRTARPGVAYYYQLQEIETTGRANTYGPISVQADWFDWRWGVVYVLLAGGAAGWVWRRRYQRS